MIDKPVISLHTDKCNIVIGASASHVCIISSDYAVALQRSTRSTYPHTNEHDTSVRLLNILRASMHTGLLCIALGSRCICRRVYHVSHVAAGSLMRWPTSALSPFFIAIPPCRMAYILGDGTMDANRLIWFSRALHPDIIAFYVCMYVVWEWRRIHDKIQMWNIGYVSTVCLYVRDRARIPFKFELPDWIIIYSVVSGLLV